MWRRSIYPAFILLITVFSTATSIQDASAEDSDDSLKRLFTDPQTRARMNSARRGDPASVKSQQTPSTEMLHIDGVMIRSNGDNVVWINGKSSLSGKQDGIYARTRNIDRNTYRVPVKINNRTVNLKPGQAWSVGNGNVSDED